MSPPSLILLSESAPAEALAVALQRVPDGERLIVAPPSLQGSVGSEPALNINQPAPHLRLQLIDSAIGALRPKTVIGDARSLEEVVLPTLDRHPQLRYALILSDGSEKRKTLKAIGAQFDSHEIETI